jgi:hypothetical protein
LLSELRSPSRDAEELAQILEDPAIGGFSVEVLLDQPAHLVREEIEGFFADRRLDDLLVLYVSCHGVKDAAGVLHFAASTTKLSRLASTGISADFVYEQIERCRARRVLLLLDCCYSGAYLAGHRVRSGQRAAIELREGRGRAVITSSTALEYSFEIDSGKITGAAAPSLFTTALVEGLRTGDADCDGDGLISVDDLYAYVYERVREASPHQTPEKKWGDIRGEFIIARNPHPPAAMSEPSPVQLATVENPHSRARKLISVIVPRPELPRHPIWRKTYLWLISLAAMITCIEVLAATLAPPPGRHYQPMGGLLGILGLLISAWIGWYAHRVPLSAAKDTEPQHAEQKRTNPPGRGPD